MGGNGFSSGFFGLVTMLALWGAGCARADDTPAATPYRPTIANPAALSAPGWLEVEAGFQGDRGRDLSGDSVPYLLKYAFTNDWGLLLGGNAYIRNVDLGGQASDGFGDTELLVKHRIPVLDGTAFGFETGARFPTARAGLGSGKTDYLFTGVLSSDFGLGDNAPQLDLNLGATRIGAHESGAGRVELNWAASVSDDLAPRWNAALELSGADRRGVADTRQLLEIGRASCRERV